MSINDEIISNADKNLKTPVKPSDNEGLGVTEMKDMSTKQKMIDNVDIM